MDPLTADQLRLQSDLIAAKLPDDNGGANDAKLLARAGTAIVLVSSLTFRLIPPVASSVIDGEPFEPVPDALVPLATRAVALMVERELVLGEAEFAEQLATGLRLRGFSAGPYSESYFAPGEFARKGASQSRPSMDADDALDAALWALATQDAREYFIAQATGVTAPAGVVASFDYRRSGDPFRRY